MDLQRWAKALTHGQAILDFLRQQHISERLYQAARDGTPSISSVYDALVTKFGSQVEEDIAWEFIRHAVHDIMSSAGYEKRMDEGRFDHNGLSRPDPIYYTNDLQRLDGDILRAMLSGLEPLQLGEVMKLANDAINHGRSVTRMNLGEMRRTAGILTDGEAILDFLCEQGVRDRLLQAAQEGKPPSLRIYDDLFAQFGPQVQRNPVRKFVCNACYAILKQEGYLPDGSGPLDRSSINSRRVTYTKVVRDRYCAEVLWAMMCGLDEHELLRVVDLAEEARMMIDEDCEAEEPS
jgi:hypothetical protein